jgi:hypothetical protein
MLKKLMCAAVAALTFGAAHADVISVSTTQDPTDFHVTSSTPLTLTFDLNAALTAQSALASNISFASIDFELNDPAKGTEVVTITFGPNGSIQSYTDSSQVANGASDSSYIVTLNNNALNDLKADGIISALLSVSSGDDYYFDKATLTANVTVPGSGSSGTDVPEPGTLAIAGLGLMGLALSRRKMR